MDKSIPGLVAVIVVTTIFSFLLGALVGPTPGTAEAAGKTGFVERLHDPGDTDVPVVYKYCDGRGRTIYVTPAVSPHNGGGPAIAVIEASYNCQ